MPPNTLQFVAFSVRPIRSPRDGRTIGQAPARESEPNALQNVSSYQRWLTPTLTLTCGPHDSSIHCDATTCLHFYDCLSPSLLLMMLPYFLLVIFQGRVPLIGVGGIATAEDAYEKIKLGILLPIFFFQLLLLFFFFFFFFFFPSFLYLLSVLARRDVGAVVLFDGLPRTGTTGNHQTGSR